MDESDGSGRGPLEQESALSVDIRSYMVKFNENIERAMHFIDERKYDSARHWLNKAAEGSRKTFGEFLFYDNLTPKDHLIINHCCSTVKERIKRIDEEIRSYRK